MGFFADGKLKRINLAAGAVQVLADAPVPRGGTWNVDDVIVFSPIAAGALMRVPASGGVVAPDTRLTSDKAAIAGHSFCRMVVDFSSRWRRESRRHMAPI